MVFTQRRVFLTEPLRNVVVCRDSLLGYLRRDIERFCQVFQFLIQVEEIYHRRLRLHLIQRLIRAGRMTAEDTFDLRHENPAVMSCSGNEVVSLARKVETDIRGRNTGVDAQEAIASQEESNLVTHADALSAQNNIDGCRIAAP